MAADGILSGRHANVHCAFLGALPLPCTQTAPTCPWCDSATARSPHGSPPRYSLAPIPPLLLLAACIQPHCVPMCGVVCVRHMPPPPIHVAQVERAAAVLHAQQLAAAQSLSATSAAGFSVSSTPLPPSEVRGVACTACAPLRVSHRISSLPTSPRSPTFVFACRCPVDVGVPLVGKPVGGVCGVCEDQWRGAT